MRSVVVVAFALIAGCIETYPVTSTSEVFLPATSSTIDIPLSYIDTQLLLIEKLGMRGFTLIGRGGTPDHTWLRLTGNRDYVSSTTLGSVFYVTIEPVTTDLMRVRLMGKPTVDHRESCPSFDDTKCTTIKVWNLWGVSGHEEADVIHGLIAELELVAPAPVAAAAVR